MPGTTTFASVDDRRLVPAQIVADIAPAGSVAITPTDTGGGYAIAVVGTGPRGVSILERLGARLLGRRTDQPLTIYAIDADEIGSGRIWRSGQPRWLSMNNRCGEVTMFSGPADGAAWRPGAGPTFAQWWEHTDVRFPGPDAYAPRSLYGRYLRFVLDVVETNLPPDVELVRIPGLARGIEERDGRLEVLVGDHVLACDRVVVCTGHPREQPERSLLAGWTDADRHRRAAGPPVRRPARPRSVVGIHGLGLTFHDVLAMLTVGRGGRFVGTGLDCEYVPSGEEPDLIVAGSRSGLPIPVRGVSQLPFDARHTPRLLTHDTVARLRAGGPLDFRADVLPWVEAEANLAFWRRRLDPGAFARLEETLPELPREGAEALSRLRRTATELGCRDAIDLEAVSQPFRGCVFSSQGEFRRAVRRQVTVDVREAMRGEDGGAVKAAMDVVRTVRPLVQAAVDFGGLTAASAQDFARHLGPTMAFLSTGPSPVRSCQLIALLRSGLLDLLGPQARFAPHDDGFLAHSPVVAADGVVCSDVIDARIRPPDLDRGTEPLASTQRDTGVWRAFVHAGDPAFRTGGVDVTRRPYHPIAADGSVERRMYVIGIPTEFTRWFMQVGIARPGPWGDFVRDADAIAGSALGDLGLTELPAVTGTGASGLGDMDYCFGP